VSGHSKWSSIKHKKGAADAKRGKLFSKIVREITMAAKAGGGDPAGNSRLRMVIDKANAANMPKDNIEKAIKKGTGELPGVTYIEIVYEGYGPGGVAVMVNASTDNKNRTAAVIRKTFSDHGGNLGESGCVSWMFKQKSYIQILKTSISEDDLMEKVIDLEVEDIDSSEEDYYQIITAPDKFSEVKSQISDFVEIADAEVTMLPNTYIKLSGNEARSMLKLMDELDDNEDIQSIFSNFDISREDIENFS
jgi:YebC/PmpR family DNA-binding regulatory protein